MRYLISLIVLATFIGCDPAHYNHPIDNCIIISSPDIANSQSNGMIDSLASVLENVGIRTTVVNAKSLSIKELVDEAKSRVDSLIKEHSGTTGVIGYGEFGGPAAMCLAGELKTISALVLMSSVGISGKEGTSRISGAYVKIM